jgi:hypothetical protein
VDFADIFRDVRLWTAASSHGLRIKQDQAVLRELQAAQNTIAAMCLKLDTLFLPVDTSRWHWALTRYCPAGRALLFDLSLGAGHGCCMADMVEKAVSPPPEVSIRGQQRPWLGIFARSEKTRKEKHIQLFWYLACFL